MVLSSYLKNKQNRINGTNYTESEIEGQVELWQDVYNMISEKKESLNDFLLPLLKLKDLRIILTGAGSSAFIGDAVKDILQFETQRITQAIATTDLITHPRLFFIKELPTLMISFARSGNSPESLEAVNLANIYCKKVFHLIITCNEDGQMIQNTSAPNYFTFILPENANDKALAMTGSFTSMLLSITIIAKLHQLEELKSSLYNLMDDAKHLMVKYGAGLKKIADQKFERVIFLGSGPLLGIARECHLKLQELTDGQVICKYDSYLGFRHGPRVVANEKSLIVYLFSDDDHVFQYEKDLANAIDTDSIPTVSFGRKISGLKNSILDIEFAHAKSSKNEFYFISATLLGQILGLYKSIALGLNPDTPSLNGRINRVVEGVSIYPVQHLPV